ncbi:ExbD/TolR family protein [Magnetospirillum fulvum]|uniref:Outer membrane transport energization protein ExbD n=1 Tax=Magnetospirillum fulvum TaxID=1082 RepID=A0A1H6J846_MAGFU|nr:biopolymer transporter ExbD [Magnetospirillum fulvum]SEH58369.1 outer membrane transport energization protein ExbD [Magnetospirillum fulvum]
MSDDNAPEAVIEINTTPLIDVLLVLLIMLIVTIPAHTHIVDLALPTQGETATRPVATVTISIDDSGAIRWNGEQLDGADALDQRLAVAATQMPKPDIVLRPHAKTAYRHVVAAMNAVRRHQIDSFTLP